MCCILSNYLNTCPKCMYTKRGWPYFSFHSQELHKDFSSLNISQNLTDAKNVMNIYPFKKKQVFINSQEQQEKMCRQYFCVPSYVKHPAADEKTHILFPLQIFNVKAKMLAYEQEFRKKSSLQSVNSAVSCVPGSTSPNALP